MLHDLVALLKKRLGGSPERGDHLEARMDRLERRLIGLEGRLGRLDGRVPDLDDCSEPGVITPAECQAITGLCNYWFDRIDARFDRMEAKFKRHEASRSRVRGPGTYDRPDAEH